MAITVAWDNVSPADTDDPRNGASDIRTLKLGLNERLAAAGIFIEDPSGTDADAGKQAAGIMATNKWTLYETDLTTKMAELDDNTTTMTLGDGVGASNPYEIVTDKVTARRTDFDKQSGLAYTFSFAGIPTGTTLNWPSAASEVEITVSDEALPVVLFSGTVTLALGGVGGTYLMSVIAIEYELNSSGTWVASSDFDLSAGVGSDLVVPGTNLGEGTSYTVTGMLNNPRHSISAGDVIKLRWNLTAPAGNTDDVDLAYGSLLMHELTK